MPTGDQKALYDYSIELVQSTSLEEMNKTWANIAQLYYDSCLMLYPVDDVISPIVCANRLHNYNTDIGYLESNKFLSYSYIQ